MAAIQLGMFAVFAMLVAILAGIIMRNKMFVLILGTVGAFICVLISAVMCVR